MNADGECGCLADDLAPCGEMQDNCELGHRGPCPGATEDDGYCTVGGECDWHIYPGPRPEATEATA